MKREMETKEPQVQKEQPKFEDLFEPTIEEEDDEIEGDFGTVKPVLKYPSQGNSRRASASAVISEDFDQERDMCSRDVLEISLFMLTC